MDPSDPTDGNDRPRPDDVLRGATLTMLDPPCLSSPSPPRAWRSFLAAAVAGAVVLAGCGGISQDSSAPVITVVTGLWPFAEAAAQIGQGNVTVVDVIPAGSDPRTAPLDTAARAQVAKATLVVESSGGFQPAFTRAAALGHRRAVVVPPAPAGGYAWLDPYAMESAARSLAAAMESADPAASAVYRNGLDNFEAQLASLDADYESTLSACATETLLTADTAFNGLSSRYPIKVRPIDGTTPAPLFPNPATVASEVTTIKASRVGRIYDETWYPQSSLIPASARAGVPIGTLDTLESPPAKAAAGGSTYFDRMEANLGVLSRALSCNASAASS